METYTGKSCRHSMIACGPCLDGCPPFGPTGAEIERERNAGRGFGDIAHERGVEPSAVRETWERWMGHARTPELGEGADS